MAPSRDGDGKVGVLCQLMGVRIFPYVEEAFDIKDKHPLSMGVRVKKDVSSGTVGCQWILQARAQ